MFFDADLGDNSKNGKLKKILSDGGSKSTKTKQEMVNFSSMVIYQQ